MIFSPVLGAMPDVDEDEKPEEPAGLEERSPTPQPPSPPGHNCLKAKKDEENWGGDRRRFVGGSA
jgi:hypothetical protein